MNQRELAFCNAYVVTHNAEQSALEAGYSPTNARKNAWQILNRPSVQEQLNYLAGAARELVSLELKDVIEQLSAIAFARPTDYMEVDDQGRWRFKSPHKLSDRELIAVKAVHVAQTGDSLRPCEYRYRFHDKLKALLMLGKHLGLYSGTAAADHTPNPFENVPQDRLDALTREMENVINEAKRVDAV